MRIKFHHILFALLCVISPCGFMVVQAQDSTFPGTEVDDLGVDKESEKVYSPGELDPAFRKAQTAATVKDSVGRSTTRLPKVQSPDANNKPVKRPSQEDDSILSFNFLYYIFQKYKMQDIVD